MRGCLSVQASAGAVAWLWKVLHPSTEHRRQPAREPVLMASALQLADRHKSAAVKGKSNSQLECKSPSLFRKDRPVVTNLPTVGGGKPYCEASSVNPHYSSNLQLFSLQQAFRYWNELQESKTSITAYEIKERLVFIIVRAGTSLSQLLGQNSSHRGTTSTSGRQKRSSTRLSVRLTLREVRLGASSTSATVAVTLAHRSTRTFPQSLKRPVRAASISPCLCGTTWRQSIRVAS